jgi:hypothetical protein
VVCCRPEGVVHPDVPAGELFDHPPRILFHPVVVSALRVRVAQAGPAAGLVRNVVFEVGSGGGPPAAGAGACGVPDLGQVRKTYLEVRRHAD